MTHVLKPYEFFLYRDIASYALLQLLNSEHVKNIDGSKVKIPSNGKLQKLLLSYMYEYPEFKKIKHKKIIIINTCSPKNNIFLYDLPIEDSSVLEPFYFVDNSISIDVHIINLALKEIFLKCRRSHKNIKNAFNIKQLHFLEISGVSAKKLLYYIKKFIISDELAIYHIKQANKQLLNDSNKLFKLYKYNNKDFEKECLKRIKILFKAIL